MKKTLTILFTAITFSSCITSGDLVNDLDMDAGWYCNIWGNLVVHGTITNNGVQRASEVDIKVQIRNANGTTTTKRFTITEDIAAGNSIYFKEWYPYPYDDDPNSVSVVIVDAW